MICIASGGDIVYDVSRGGVPFHLVCSNANIDSKVWEGFNLAVPWFVKGCVGVGVGGQPRSGGKVK